MKIIEDPRSIPGTLLAALLATAAAACGGDDTPEDDDATSEDGTTSAIADTSTDTATEASADTGSTSDETTSDTTDGTETSDSSDTSSTGSEICEQDQLELPGDDFYPEGTAYDPDGTLYVASLATGAVVQMIPCETDPEELVAAGGPLRNPVGMIVDEASDWLIVCDSDFSFTAPPSIDVLERRTGALVATHEFDSVGFCNDLAIDGDGNVYATDSAGARVLRVRASDLMTDSPAESWATDPDFVVGEGEFGLNGIAWDEADGLYVVNSQQGELHRITIEGSGDAGAITPIAIDGGPLQTPDGMKWTGGGELLVIEGGLGALSRVVLDGDAASVEVVANGFDFPTTFGLIGGQAWVAEGQLDHFIGLDPEPPEPPFVVSRVALE
ncbi:MAG: SMP-30/gluconolactonase/LRE family protein [Myxococcales bacterium]|nr:SMP-30/gluconolactonase/LRE family protein [Myxococcales bacterium]